MLGQLRTALVMVVLMTLLTGVAYPLVTTGIALAIFPGQANGSLIVQDDNLVGSQLIGQPFTSSKYFWGRPSATSPVPYNAAASSGSNLGPTNPQYLESIKERVATLKAAHPDQQGDVPADLVTASASGLDPHISPEAAEYQVNRVAQARHLNPTELRAIVAAHTEGRTLGLLGEPRVIVLQLNLSLDYGDQTRTGVTTNPKPGSDSTSGSGF